MQLALVANDFLPRNRCPGTLQLQFRNLAQRRGQCGCSGIQLQ